MGLHLSGRPAHRAAVLGRPIEHSLSPVLHTAAYAALGLTDWDYSRRDCGAEDVAPLLAASGPEWAGFSVTMPGKRAALAAADRSAPTAAAVGAANTLVHQADGSWTAHNTDVAGIRAALDGRADAPVVVLGAGGTAQAAVVALAGLDVGELTVCVRDPGRTAELRAAAERAGVGVRLASLAVDDPALGAAATVISTLPAGVADPLAAVAWRPAVRLLDAVYIPWPTALARAITAAGGTVIAGTEILLHQAAAQVELMTGRTPAPLEAMRRALDAAVPQ